MEKNQGSSLYFKSWPCIGYLHKKLRNSYSNKKLMNNKEHMSYSSAQLSICGEIKNILWTSPEFYQNLQTTYFALRTESHGNVSFVLFFLNNKYS